MTSGKKLFVTALQMRKEGLPISLSAMIYKEYNAKFILLKVFIYQKKVLFSNSITNSAKTLGKT